MKTFIPKKLLIFFLYLCASFQIRLVRSTQSYHTKDLTSSEVVAKDDKSTGNYDVVIQPISNHELNFTLSYFLNYTSPSTAPFSETNPFYRISKKSRETKDFNHLQKIINDPDLYFQAAFVELNLRHGTFCSDIKRDSSKKDFEDILLNTAAQHGENKRENDTNVIASYLMNHTAWIHYHHQQNNKKKFTKNMCSNTTTLFSDDECNNDTSTSSYNDYGGESNKIIHDLLYSEQSKSKTDFITSVNMTDSFVIPKRKNAIDLAYECRIRKMQKEDHTVLVIDILPLLRRWLEGISDSCPKQKTDLETFIFSFLIDGTLMSFDSTDPDLSKVLDQLPLIRFRYAMDKRCTIPIPLEEKCLFGDCRNDRICRLRSYCPSTVHCGVSCDFERPCAWKWNVPRNGETGFQNMSAAQVISKIRKVGEWAFRGPLIDTDKKTEGHFLLLAFENGTRQQTHYRLTSPMFSDSQPSCYLQASVHMHNMEAVALKMVIFTQNHSSYVPMSLLGNGRNTWERLVQRVGKYTQPFQITLEVDNHVGIPSHFAIDDIRLVDCFPSENSCKASCSDKEFQCSDGTCISRNQICDLNKDCMFGEDEDQNCDKMPANTTCSFEKGWCGWTPQNQYNITWERTNKPHSTEKSGPKFDHTYGNSSGHMLLVNMKATTTSFHQAVLRSPVFAHPPFYNQNRSSPYFESCQLRFFYHMFGAHVESLDVELVLKNPRNPWAKPIRFCERSGNQGNMWKRAACKLPSIKGSKKYYLQITATRGIRGSMGDIAIDDISLSPECVGLGVHPNEVIGYDYNEILNSSEDNPGNLTVAYRFTTCNNTGRLGPTHEQCAASYNATHLANTVSIDTVRKGVQIWTVPETRSYTLIAKGASGGRGALVNQMTSHGSVVKVTMFLRKGEKIYILVGQEGVSVCEQPGVVSVEKDQICKMKIDKYSALELVLRKSARQATPPTTSKPRPPDDIFLNLSKFNKINGGGGGGGGATFIYRMNGNTLVPILVAAGGGGLGYNASATIYPNGHGLNVTLQPHSGSTQSWGAGGGGSWEGPIVKNNNTAERDINFNSRFRTSTQDFQDNTTMLISAGLSLVDGDGLGGQPCIASHSWGAAGGFGGGGGGCVSGGGGGGFVGGNAHVSLSANGEGGWSYIGKGGMYPAVEPGGHGGPGEFIAIPSFAGCGCDHACVLLDDFEPHSGCVCHENWILSEDGINCIGRDVISGGYMIALIICGVILLCVLAVLCFCLYNRYQRQKVSMLRRKVLGGPELQLSRLRAQAGPGGVLTEYNPNYEFGGETYTLTDLKEIPRENLRLVKALGQGAFGEVYQGFYKHRDGDAVEMPVAVKTLPELSSNQAEMDFLMEALIMSKFNHPNIVHFIGVCFDKHPRFIILELLAGGDLKTFLRESRPKPDKGSPLSMKDLLLCAMDVAKGSKYLEDNHFIHRDIAARNCLLTTKGPGRVVKIADFGMARDIYRADYYKKGGKAMLPVKWMPPEAFLDGIFTSKTDVWSYGVLLWEIFSLGYMPYPGRGNQDVMQLVTNGGRLEPPSNCPTPVYGIMTQCWHPIPEERPNFTTIMERLGYCIQDPEVMNAPLPIFQRPPSSERDTTLMRPPNPDDLSCLRIVHGHYPRKPSPLSHNEPLSPNSSTADYLVPLTPLSNPSTPVPLPEQNVKSPKSPSPMPESQSTETILDEDEEENDNEAKVEHPLNNPAQPPKTSSTTVSASNSKKPNANGIDSGITLNPSSLESTDKSKKSVPYGNVSAKKKSDSKVDEEIRC